MRDLNTILISEGMGMNLYRSLLVRFGIAFFFCGPLTAGAEVIFQEDFDSQSDFTSTMHTLEKAQRVTTGHILPEGWNALYQGTQWSPETGYPDNHASLEILARNADKAYGGQGKSAVMWRESYSLGWRNWASDSQLMKYLEAGYDELYVEFDISFSENFYGRNNASNYASKLFRIGSWTGEGSEFNGAAGELGPVVIWDYKRDAYGLRNVISFRGGPYGEYYYFKDQYATDVSWSFSSDLRGMAVGGGDPELYAVDGETPLVSMKASSVTHDDVFGPPGKWTKVAFYVKLNSQPGIADGVFRQWINGERIVNKENVPWILANDQNKMAKWNYFAIGGNDYFQPYDNSVRFEDWYAFDNVVVLNNMPGSVPVGDEAPETGAGGSVAPSSDMAPAPPSNLSVQ
ncbi:hypothetical protein ACFOZ5_05530 [Marinobacter lacisalsi]|uniref:Uncharacterized protein n=1 Tax=Marinobacter lacisalsi TaxID=475979 RepID=A0ABV8QG23_9GAMM